MFKCSNCGAVTSLPKCQHCGHLFERVDGIYQLTNDPNANLDDAGGIKYLGYDRVGPYYSGREWLKCGTMPMSIAEKASDLIAHGVLLDLGCGDGMFAVPAALQGCTVIAGDISGVMLERLLKKAAVNNADPSKILPCRMNALAIPLADNCVDGAMVNSVLHLISEPSGVIHELYRVLKPGGKLMFVGNSPGLSDTASQELKEINKDYLQCEAEFHKRYWEVLKGFGVFPTRYSWKFDQRTACEAIFGNYTQIEFEFSEQSTTKLSDYFLYRMGGKGFSDQQGVPDGLHDLVFTQVVNEFRETYGQNFDDIAYVSVTSGITLHVFEKALLKATA